MPVAGPAAVLGQRGLDPGLRGRPGGRGSLSERAHRFVVDDRSKKSAAALAGRSASSVIIWGRDDSAPSSVTSSSAAAWLWPWPGLGSGLGLGLRFGLGCRSRVSRQPGRCWRLFASGRPRASRPPPDGTAVRRIRWQCRADLRSIRSPRSSRRSGRPRRMALISAVSSGSIRSDRRGLTRHRQRRHPARPRRHVPSPRQGCHGRVDRAHAIVTF